jgi:hypothetical protein
VLLVSSDYRCSFIYTKDPMVSSEVLAADVNLRTGPGLNVAEPVSLRAKGAHDDRLRIARTIFHYFQNCSTR